LPDAVGTASLRPSVDDARIDGQSLRGDGLDWWKGDVVCGSIPGRGERSERVKVIVVAPESNVPIMAEGLRQMLRAIDDPRLTAAILTEGTPECGAVDVPVIRGATGGTATVFVLDRDDRVVLETFDLPPAPFLVRQLGEPGV